tara:strand:- start:4078 stop:4326 length:249 start_codon:yes stop_codon:yes gene_type:complete
MVSECSNEELRRVSAGGIDISLAEVYTGEPLQGIPQAQIVNMEREQTKDVEKCERDMQACIVCILISIIGGGIIYLATVSAY